MVERCFENACKTEKMGNYKIRGRSVVTMKIWVGSRVGKEN